MKHLGVLKGAKILYRLAQGLFYDRLSSTGMHSQVCASFTQYGDDQNIGNYVMAMIKTQGLM